MSSVIWSPPTASTPLSPFCQGWISGGYNAIAGRINGPGSSVVGDISGYWSSTIEFKDARTGQKELLFDVNTVKAVEKTVIPEEEQEVNESRR
jgi:hypothetical protein